MMNTTTSVQELTRIALRDALKERDKWKSKFENEKASKEWWRSEYDKMVGMYNNLTDPLLRIAQYCGIIPPKTITTDRTITPFEYLINMEPVKLYDYGDAPEMAMYRIQLEWVYALAEEYYTEIQKFQHFKLMFNDGKTLAYNYTPEMRRIWSTQNMVKEVAELLVNALLRKGD